MVKKFKALSENQLAQTVRESAHQIWLAGLGAYSKAQEEARKLGWKTCGMNFPSEQLAFLNVVAVRFVVAALNKVWRN